MKDNGASKKPLKKNESLRQHIEEDLVEIHGNVRLVRSLFGAERVVDAAD